MYDEILLNVNQNFDKSSKADSLVDLDDLFDNLSSDINHLNKYIEDLNKKEKENVLHEKEIMEEKLRIDKSKLDFENYMKAANEEYNKKMEQVDDYINNQKENLLRAELDFKNNMDNSINELQLEKKELEIQKEKFREEKEQFEAYKTLELNRIKHAQEILESDKNQFEKYKEVSNKKLELENKNLEQKCDKFKELISKFNSSFKPIIKEEE